MLHLITTGARDYELRASDYLILNALNPSMIYVGDASGADTCVWEWACNNPNAAGKRFNADWAAFGKAAGPRRNRGMLMEALHDSERMGITPILLAFPGDKGTRDCILQARAQAIPVVYSYLKEK